MKECVTTDMKYQLSEQPYRIEKAHENVNETTMKAHETVNMKICRNAMETHKSTMKALQYASPRKSSCFIPLNIRESPHSAAQNYSSATFCPSHLIHMSWLLV